MFSKLFSWSIIWVKSFSGSVFFNVNNFCFVLFYSKYYLDSLFVERRFIISYVKVIMIRSDNSEDKSVVCRNVWVKVQKYYEQNFWSLMSWCLFRACFLKESLTAGRTCRVCDITAMSQSGSSMKLTSQAWRSPTLKRFSVTSFVQQLYFLN